ncbi:MAG: hypothetical protein ABIR76_15910, partial [Polaromonas sp.]
MFLEHWGRGNNQPLRPNRASCTLLYPRFEPVGRSIIFTATMTSSDIESIERATVAAVSPEEQL